MQPTDLQTALPSIDSFDTATAMMFGLRMTADQIPGQFLDTQNGVIPTTVYHKPASHPDVEAVKGELIYAPKKETHDIDEVKAKNQKLEDIVITMQAQLQALMSKQTAPPAPVEGTVSLAEFETMKAENKKLKNAANLAKARASRGKTKAGNKPATP